MQDLSRILTCVTDSWSPQIGDPSVMGWVTVLAYVAAMAAALRASRLAPRDRRFWLFLAVVLLLLGVNKQLDLQSALTAGGRCIARLQGWYAERRQVQFLFILGIGVLCIAVLLGAAVRMRGALRRIGVALLGFGLLLGFVAVRAVGFHHFDALLHTDVLGAQMNWVLELGGISLILLNALAVLRGARNGRRLTPRRGKGP